MNKIVAKLMQLNTATIEEVSDEVISLLKPFSHGKRSF
jgi:hypothetical protein